MTRLLRIAESAAAGLVGAAAMHGFRRAWESVPSNENRHTIFGFDRESDTNSARRIHRMFSRESLAEREGTRLAIALHYASGAALGMVYNIASPHASGAKFGALLWVLANEIPISAGGASDPFQKSLASHAGAFAAHIIFGVATSRASRMLQIATLSS